VSVAVLHIASPLEFHEISRKVYSLLDVPAFELHESESYPGGTYFQEGPAT
jgi:hypothetical protein